VTKPEIESVIQTLNNFKMGIPTEETTATNAPGATPEASAQSTQAKPELTPEALDLAAKLFDYARAGDTSSLQQYLTAGIPPNLTNHEGNTLLMLAAYNGHPETVAFLLERNADTNVLNGRGQSPLAGAVFKGYDEVVKLLIEKGVDVKLGQPNAIDCAKMFKRTEALKLMGVEE
jgi:ankyrin repeat protein